jgi:hypothetical protein
VSGVWALLGVLGCGTVWELEDRDGDGYTWLEGDCDDATAFINPGADELCDDIDHDCDGLAVEDDAIDAERWYGDADYDGYGLDADYIDSCEAPDGYVAEGGDCDDTDDGRYPGAAEVIDGVDNDCDGDIDE